MEERKYERFWVEEEMERFCGVENGGLLPPKKQRENEKEKGLNKNYLSNPFPAQSKFTLKCFFFFCNVKLQVLCNVKLLNFFFSLFFFQVYCNYKLSFFLDFFLLTLIFFFFPFLFLGSLLRVAYFIIKNNTFFLYKIFI